MSEKGAAPGPWTVTDCRDLNGAWWIEAEDPGGDKFSIAEVRNGCEEADDVCSVEANAALIAAAPELLSVLNAFVAETVDYMTRNKLGDPEQQHNVKWARQVMAKAGAAP